jgi:glycosyltransferase involved in cell wall biosynthesis
LGVNLPEIINMTRCSIQREQVAKRVLFATPILHHPPLGGPDLRVENTIKALSRISELYVYCRTNLASIGGPEAQKFYERYAQKCYFAPFAFPGGRGVNFAKRASNALSRRVFGRPFFDAGLKESFNALLDLADQINADVIWLGYGNVSYPLLKYLKERQGRPVVLDTDSVWSRFILRGLPYTSTDEERAEIEIRGSEKVEEERWGTALADVTTAVSEVDAEYYRTLAKTPDRVQILCNAIDFENYWPRPPAPPKLKRPCLLLAGTFGFRSPMEDAARWMIDDIFPLIQREVPNVHLYIVGKHSDRVLADIHNPEVTVRGTVPSVLPYLHYSAAALVSLRYESGTRFKILEAGACGIPVVSTTLGAEGLAVKDGENILIADDVPDFAKCAIDILTQASLGARLGQNLQELVHTNHSVQVLARQAGQILDLVNCCRDGSLAL